jgi:hypothetical protein
MAAVGAFEDDSNRKSLVKPHPIQSLFDIWQAANGSAVLLKEPPSDTLHFSLKALARVAQQRNVRAHSWPYSIEQVFPEISEHVPVTIVHQRKNRLARVGVLPLGDVQVPGPRPLADSRRPRFSASRAFRSSEAAVATPACAA